MDDSAAPQNQRSSKSVVTHAPSQGQQKAACVSSFQLSERDVSSDSSPA